MSCKKETFCLVYSSFTFQIPSKNIPAPLYGLLSRSCDWHGAKVTFVPIETLTSDTSPFDDLTVNVFTLEKFGEKYSSEG